MNALNVSNSQLDKLNFIKFPKNIKNSINAYSKFIKFQIYNIVLNKKFFFCYLLENTVFLYDINLGLTLKIDLKNLKDLYLIGRYSLNIKFFTQLNNKNLILKIKLFSQFQRDVIIENIIKGQANQDFNFMKRKIFQIIKDKDYLLDEIASKLRNKLQKTGHLYLPEVYDTLKSQNNEKSKFKRNIFVFSELKLIQSSFKILFYNINQIRFDTSDLEENYFDYLASIRTHNDSISIKKGTYEKKRSIRKEIEEVVNHSLNSIDCLLENYENKDRPRHKGNPSRSNHIRNPNYFSSNISMGNGMKHNFNKVSFNVNLLKYFKKESRILELSNNGAITILQKNKPDNILTFLIDEIKKLEGNYTDNLLNINLRDAKKPVYLELANNYEKYLFRTIIYNHIVKINF